MKLKSFFFLDYFNWSLYAAINSLFILKYGLRFASLINVIFLLIIYLLSTFLIFNYLLPKIKSSVSKVLPNFIIIICIILIVIQNQIDPNNLKVDRWSAIHNFLEYLFQGQYPYSAQTHLGGYGSPFPVWQIFHIPFYVIGNVGLSFFLCLILFLDSIRRLYGSSIMYKSFLILIVSPSIIYEVFAYSDLISNFLLCAAIIFYFKVYSINLKDNLILIGIITGLMTSTRLSVLIPFALYYFSEFCKLRVKKQVVFVFLVIGSFFITFLPFLLWNGNMLIFFEYNPFILQSRQGNLSDFLLFLPIGIILALNWKSNFQKYLFNTGLMLTLFVSVSIIHNMFLYSNFDALFESFYDITYFNMAMPFIIAFIASKKFSLKGFKALSDNQIVQDHHTLHRCQEPTQDQGRHNIEIDINLLDRIELPK